METDGEVLARRWCEDLFNQRDVTAIDLIIAPDFVQHAPGGMEIRGSGSLKELFTFYYATFTDSHWTIEDLFTAGDKVVVRARGDGRYQGGWHNIPGQGQHVTETCIAIFRLADGKIREMWFEVSDLDVAHQLGAFPPKETSPAGSEPHDRRQ